MPSSAFARPDRPAPAAPAAPPPTAPPAFRTARSLKILMLSPDCAMIDRRILQQARTLIAAGHRVTLLSGFETPREQHTVEDGIEIYRFAYDWDDERLKRIRARLPRNERLQRWVNLIFMKVIRRMLRLMSYDVFVLAKIREHPSDVIHVHDLPMLKYGAMVAKEWNVPLVFDAHEIYHEQQCFSTRQKLMLRRQERVNVPKTSLFFTVNDAIADHFEKLYGIRPRVLLNAAESPAPGFDADSRVRLRQRAGLPPDAVVVLFQGWISAERNLDTLVRAAAHLPGGAYLVIIGYGDHVAALKQIAADLNLDQKVRFLGEVPAQSMLALTAGADLGVIPYQPIDLNHTLCSPNKFFEYVQAGVPIVAHDLAFFRGMAEQYGVVSVGDLSTVDGMAAAINGLLGDRPRLHAMRESCRRAAEVLNWEVEGRKLVDAYETELVGKMPPCAV